MTKDKLSALRQQIADSDSEILSLIAKRLDLARAIGQVKLAADMPIKDFRTEKDVIERNRQLAKQLGLYESLAEDISKLLIQYSVATQDEFHTRAKVRQGNQKTILVVGGGGRMGMWLSDFFTSFGHSVSHLDPGKSASRYPKIADLGSIDCSIDTVVLATPIVTSAAVLEELIDRRCQALIFDVCSLKTPMVPAIEKALAKGLNVTSIHPMFGPDVEILAGRNIIFCEVDHPTATDEAELLFHDTTATRLRVGLDDHDRLMGYVLGLSHLSNLVFARVLCQSGIAFDDLMRVASTTFNAQLDVVRPVVEENQALYFEIQSENGFTAELIGKIQEELRSYAATIDAKDEQGFSHLMDVSRRYLAKSC